MNLSKSLPAWAAVIGLGCSLGVQAADWDVTSACSGVTSCVANNATHPDLRMRGYTGTSSGGTSTWAATNMQVWGSHLGVGGEGASPQHAIDNNGAKEGILLDFFEGTASQKIALESLTLGWWSRDYDISVLYYDAPAVTTTNVMNGWGVTSGNVVYQTGGSMWANWKVLGNYAVTGKSETPNTSSTGLDCANASECTKVIDLKNMSDIASSHWLVMAYSTAVGGAKVGTGTLSVGNDFFKLMSFNGNRQVPVPTPLALTALGLVGLAWLRRRQA